MWKICGNPDAPYIHTYTYIANTNVYVCVLQVIGQHRLSGQSYESGVSSRQSYHSTSSSSLGSLDRLEESGHSSTINVQQLIQASVPVSTDANPLERGRLIRQIVSLISLIRGGIHPRLCRFPWNRNWNPWLMTIISEQTKIDENKPQQKIPSNPSPYLACPHSVVFSSCSRMCARVALLFWLSKMVTRTDIITHR